MVSVECFGTHRVRFCTILHHYGDFHVMHRSEITREMGIENNGFGDVMVDFAMKMTQDCYIYWLKSTLRD